MFFNIKCDTVHSVEIELKINEQLKYLLLKMHVLESISPHNYKAGKKI